MGTYWGFISLKGWNRLLYIGGRGREIGDMIYKKNEAGVFSLFFVLKVKINFWKTVCGCVCLLFCDGKGSVYVEKFAVL